MAKETPEHKDKLGRLLKLGDCVVYPSHNSLEIGTVKKLNNKMVKVWKVGASAGRWYTGTNKYPQDIVVVDGPEVTMYLIKASAS